MRLFFVRHSTVVVEMLGLRVLIDPCLAPHFGAPGVLEELAPAVPAGRIGRIDVVCVTSGDIGAFHLDTVRQLDVSQARFLVPDRHVRDQLALLGHRRVRIVEAGDVVTFGPLAVTASPARGIVGAAVGFHFGVVGVEGALRQPTFWHTGPVPPIEVDARSTSFAADHEAFVVCGAASGLAVATSGPALFANVDDCATLARLARARVLLPVARGARPAGLFSWVLSARESSPVTSTAALEIVDPVPGTWYATRLRRRAEP